MKEKYQPTSLSLRTLTHGQKVRALHYGKKGMTDTGLKLVLERIKKHESLCGICNSPYRKSIERAYINWWTIKNIMEEFGIENYDTVNTHAKLFKLDKRRKNNHKGVYNRIRELGFSGIKATDIGPGHILEANRDLIRMEGGFKDNLSISGEIHSKVAAVIALPADELAKRKYEIMAQMANPEKDILSSVRSSKEISDQPEEESDIDYEYAMTIAIDPSVDTVMQEDDDGP